MTSIPFPASVQFLIPSFYSGLLLASLNGYFFNRLLPLRLLRILTWLFDQAAISLTLPNSVYIFLTYIYLYIYSKQGIDCLSFPDSSALLRPAHFSLISYPAVSSQGYSRLYSLLISSTTRYDPYHLYLFSHFSSRIDTSTPIYHLCLYFQF